MVVTNTQVRLASRPAGFPDASNFRIERSPVPELKDGEVLVQNHFLSLDPYMRGRMNEARSYAAPVALGDVMVGGTVGEVVASKNPAFAVGDKVVGAFGWQEYGVSDGRALTKVDGKLPLSVYLGAVGMPGVTAYVGDYDIGAPKEAGPSVTLATERGRRRWNVVGRLGKLRAAQQYSIAAARRGATTSFEGSASTRASTTLGGRTWPMSSHTATPDRVNIDFGSVGQTMMNTCPEPVGRSAAFRVQLTRANTTRPRVRRCRTSPRCCEANQQLQGFIVSDGMNQLAAGARRGVKNQSPRGRLRYHGGRRRSGTRRASSDAPQREPRQADRRDWCDAEGFHGS